jgi:GAF domain-containing protein
MLKMRVTPRLESTSRRVKAPSTTSVADEARPSFRSRWRSNSKAACLPSWPFATIGAVIVARATVFAIAFVTGQWATNPAVIIPPWAQLTEPLLFALVAGVLLYYGGSDRRAWSLGLFILDSACTLAESQILRSDALWPLVRASVYLRTDAFQAALLWFFASEFPKPSKQLRIARIFVFCTAVALALGVVLVITDGYAVWHGGSGSEQIGRIASTLQRRHAPDRPDWYSTLQFLWLAPLLILQPYKLRESGADDRRRFAWLVAGVAVGFLPLVSVAVVLTLWPGSVAMLRPWWHLIGTVMAAALLLVPVVAAYASLVQRTLDLRLVLRAALQYLFARSIISSVAALPAIGLVVFLYSSREQSLVSLVAGIQGATLVGLALAGAAGVLARQRLLLLLDRGFFREQLDARRTLLDLIDLIRRASTLSDVCENAARAVTDAFHPSFVCTFALGADDALHAQDAELPSLPRSSALAQIIEGGDAPVTIDSRPHSLLRRLSASEQAWLAASQAHLLIPMRGASGQLVGVLGAGDKKSELPYSADDRELLSALGYACGVALERVLTVVNSGPTPSPVDAINPCARECIECGAVVEATAIMCSCGGPVQRAAVPKVLDDRMMFMQRVATGGMGIVYRAIDLRLQQERAVKTLAVTDPALVARLKREAKAMAVVTHVNLATLHGLELWRNTPMLVMEFLQGGTLADRLMRAPVPIDEMLEHGVALAQAVGVLHASGILHRDVKPSNIGFTSEGVPKLLDFGLAKVIARTAPRQALDGDTWSATFSSDGIAIRGTPAYLSPEVLSGRAASPADDLWSLAVTLLEGCTGQNPFRSESVASTVARVLSDQRAIPAALDTLPESDRQLFSELLGPQAHRPQTADEFGRRLKLGPRISV